MHDDQREGWPEGVTTYYITRPGSYSFSHRLDRNLGLAIRQ